MTRFSLLALALSLSAVCAAPEEGALIADMDTLKFGVPKGKGSAEVVEGKFGKAVRFSLEKDTPSAFFTSNIRGNEDWDKAAGFSFWVKGEGEDHFAGIHFIYDDDFDVRYDLCFPVKGKEWQKVTVAWADLIPAKGGAKVKPLGPDGNAPSKLSALWFGKWWYWRDYPAHTFTIDEIRLEPTIERDTKDYKPEGAPLARVAAKVKAGKPITVVTMGDSLTDTKHNANRKTNWPTLLANKLKAKTRAVATVHNPAIGGAQLTQGVALMPRWLDAVPEPDLVVIWFGGNDHADGVRGPEFERACLDAVDRVRRLTKGKADVLLITTAPGATGDTTAEMAEAVRKAAKARNAGLADVAAVIGALKQGREKLFVEDRVHLSPAGHQFTADLVMKALGVAP